MGSPLGPLMANAFMCNLEEKLLSTGDLPAFYRRYVDDTLTILCNRDAAEGFLLTVNSLHPNITFTGVFL